MDDSVVLVEQIFEHGDGGDLSDTSFHKLDVEIMPETVEVNTEGEEEESQKACMMILPGEYDSYVPTVQAVSDYTTEECTVTVNETHLSGGIVTLRYNVKDTAVSFKPGEPWVASDDQTSSNLVQESSENEMNTSRESFIAVAPDLSEVLITQYSQETSVKEIRKREQDKLKKRQLRSNPIIREREKIQARARMKNRRTDPEYRARERERDKERRKQVRNKNPDYREKERVRDRNYKRSQRIRQCSELLSSKLDQSVDYVTYNIDLKAEDDDYNT